MRREKRPRLLLKQIRRKKTSLESLSSFSPFGFSLGGRNNVSCQAMRF